MIFTFSRCRCWNWETVRLSEKPFCIHFDRRHKFWQGAFQKRPPFGDAALKPHMFAATDTLGNQDCKHFVSQCNRIAIYYFYIPNMAIHKIDDAVRKSLNRFHGSTHSRSTQTSNPVAVRSCIMQATRTPIRCFKRTSLGMVASAIVCFMLYS